MVGAGCCLPGMLLGEGAAPCSLCTPAEEGLGSMAVSALHPAASKAGDLLQWQQQLALTILNVSTPACSPICLPRGAR